MPKAKLTALLATVAFLAFGAAPALASHSETVFFEAPSDLLNVGPVTQAKTFANLQSLGVHAVRIILYWRNVAPQPNHRSRPSFNQSNPAAYHWGFYDQLINAAVKRHWTILLTVSGPTPRWATPHGVNTTSYPSTSDFQQFMKAVGKRYGRHVKLWSIWNEPNEPTFLQPQYVHHRLTSPAIYRGLYLAGYKGLQQSGNFSGMKVLTGETSPVGLGTRVPAPLAFLRGLFCLNSNYKPVGHCAKLPTDGYAQHPYSESQGPFWLVPGADNVTIGVMGRLTTALDRAAAAGAVRPKLPVYIDEFGVQSYPNKIQGVPTAQQAEYLAISEQIAYNNPRIASFSQYLLRDDHPVHGHVVGFQSGLETYNGKAKPAMNGFRLTLTVTRQRDRHRVPTGVVAFWGIVRPAKKPTTLTLQYSSNGGRSWHSLTTIRTDGSGRWTATGRYASHRLWRVKWRAPSGQTFNGAAIRAYSTVGKIYY
jgi:Cellulase (glycosyl hydrolase family 5)